MRKRFLNRLLAKHGIRPIDLATKCDVNKSTVARWNENGVPLTRVYQVEKVTGIPRGILRPDFFGAAQ